MRRPVILGTVFALVLSMSVVASATWSYTQLGYGKTDTIAKGNTPGVVRSGSTYTVSWTAVPTIGESGTPPTYKVRRNGTAVTTGTCAGDVSGTSCQETDLPNGTWSYTIQPQCCGGPLTWRGAESDPSTTIDTDPPTRTSVFASNGTGTAGTPGAGDKIVLRYSEAMVPSSIISGWNGSSINATFILASFGTEADRWCVHYPLDGTLLAGFAGTVPTATMTAGGTANCDINTTDTFEHARFRPSTIVQTAPNEVTITLGPKLGTAFSGQFGTNVNGSVTWFTPCPGTDFAGNAISPCSTLTGPSQVQW